MKKQLLLSSLAALIGLSSFSQNYQPATLTTNDGNTLEGQVNYKNWKKNPATIQFRKNETSAVESYGVKDLKSFTVSGDRYISSIVDVDYRSEIGAYITTESNIITRRDTVFLQALVTGTKSLYQYYDDIEHFYIAKNDTFELLRYKKYISVTSATGRIYLYNRDFAVQLEQYFDGCESFSSGVSKAKYQARALQNVFARYYKCAAKAPDFVQKKETEKSEFGIIAGVSNTTFKISSSAPLTVLSRTKFSSSLNFAGGAFFEIVFPRQRGKMSFNNELMYASYATQGLDRVNTTPTRYEEQSFDFAYSYLKLNTMLRYKFLMNNNSAIFINGGISNGFVVTEKNRRVHYQKFNENYDRTTVSDDYLDSRVYELGILAGIGFKKNRFSVEVRAERGNGPVRAVNTAAEVFRYYGLVGYRLK